MPQSFQTSISWLSFFWAALYALRQYQRRTHQGSFLPAPRSSAPSTSPDLYRSRQTRVTLRNFHLNVQSTAWNGYHQNATARLKRRDRWRALLTLAYDIGSVLGLLGMIGSVLLLAWTTVQLGLSWCSHPTQSNISPEIKSLHKRDASTEDVPTMSQDSRSAPLYLIIPGVTTPLHHFPILLAALLTTQVIHELGHAVAAALESVSLSSVGVGFTVILPSAFVAFPAGETEILHPRPRTRIISAGAFHNLVFWGCLVVVTSLPVSHLIWPVLGYRDVSAYGRVVMDVDEDSVLFDHLSVGAVVYKVGDDTLDSSEDALDKWKTLLSVKPTDTVPSLGWCTDEPWFAARGSSCCTSRVSAGSSQACFSPFEDPSLERCLDPLPFLSSSSSSHRRCTSAVDCAHGELCIRPRGDQELVALTMHMPPWLRSGDADADVARTVVWQGDRAEILHEVEVGEWLPSYGFLPIGLPGIWSTLFMYLKMLTLSLYFFNLLPLPFLDGGQLLDTSLDWWALSRTARAADGESIALGELAEEGGSGLQGPGVRIPQNTRVTAAAASAKRNRLRQGVHVGVGALLGSCVLLSLANTYL
ncbi:hypothetical protein C8Q74DRAFT_1274160 [Fomes fomentarius]|nr:hypothetical protein C8Q74DRAFT_1274160 [Fomes fomentarius]